MVLGMVAINELLMGLVPGSPIWWAIFYFPIRTVGVGLFGITMVFLAAAYPFSPFPQAGYLRFGHWHFPHLVRSRIQLRVRRHTAFRSLAAIAVRKFAQRFAEMFGFGARPSSSLRKGAD